MKISRTRSYKINMGSYESMEVSATISLDGRDIYDEDELEDMDADALFAALKGEAEKYLDDALEHDLEQAAPLSDPGSMLRDRTPTRRTERVRNRR